jgi:hypothetical protein
MPLWHLKDQVSPRRDGCNFKEALKWSALAVVPALGVGLALSAADQSADHTLHTRNGL